MEFTGTTSSYITGASWPENMLAKREPAGQQCGTTEAAKPITVHAAFNRRLDDLDRQVLDALGEYLETSRRIQAKKAQLITLHSSLGINVLASNFKEVRDVFASL